VAWRVISLLHSIVYSLGGSFWAGVSQAIGHGDIVWIRSEAARLRRLGTLWMAVFSGGFVAVGVPVIALWTGNRLQVSPLLLVVLGIYFALLGHTMIDMAILNGANKTRQQIVTVGLDATLNLGLSVFLAHRLGYVGVGLGTLVAYSLCSFGPLQYFSWRLVAEGSRPPFWTRSLSAMVLSVGGGFGIHLGLSRIVGLGRIGVTLLGGSASLLVTMALIRGITGAEGIDAFRASFRRTARPAVASSPQPI
jgi:O-antigen/teichoic acid export membrane protein